MKYFAPSESLQLGEKTEAPIHLFLQFFIHKNKERYEEIKTCLKFNLANPWIEKIYLLNENQPDGSYKPFTAKELGTVGLPDKIIQLPIGHRMEYADAFEAAKKIQSGGYNIVANADIFFDDSLPNILKTNMHAKPLMMCQLRWEYDGTPHGIKLFGPSADSQDVWIWHSNWNDMLLNKKIFNFQLGQAGCDNHITYLFKLCGFGLVNHPGLVHCLHYHKTQIRDYSRKDVIKSPYIFIVPENINGGKSDVSFEDNTILYEYLQTKIEKNEPFVIPRIAGIENQLAFSGHQNLAIPPQYIYKMKNNAGVALTDKQSVKQYSEAYLDAFRNCDLYTGWSKIGSDNVYAWIKDSHNFIEETLCVKKKKLWAESALEIYNYIHYTPWTLALKGKRILIISAFTESIQEKIAIREKIYGRDLFPECEFVFLKPPQLAGDNPSQDWHKEFTQFCATLDTMRDAYDLALLSCGGIGNPLCNYIYTEHKKSAIYVGGVLSMFFGVWGKRWALEKKSILNMYLNEHWSRPKISERPIGWEKIEGGTYW
jgi:hypothetical protein